jgi:type I restriction enzyme M protein
MLTPEKVGPKAKLGAGEHEKNNLPDIAARWKVRTGVELKRARTAQSFSVPKSEIAAAGYDLSINRYKEAVHEATEYRPPKEIIAELKALEQEISNGLAELEKML